MEGGGRVGRGKGKGAIVSGSCGHLGDQGENEESPCSAEWPRIANGWVCQPPARPPSHPVRAGRKLCEESAAREAMVSRPLNSTGRHGLFLNSTDDFRPFLNRQESLKNSDRGHWYFLKSTGHIRPF